VIYQDHYVTYGELNVLANRLAHRLRALGVVPETHVAICLERSLDMVVAALATLKAGGCYVPLDPIYPIERLRYMLEDSAAHVVLMHARVRPEVRAHLRTARPDRVVVDLCTDAQQWAEQPLANPDRAGCGLTPEHLAYTIYTSGSSGRPKGVTVTHRALMNYLCWARTAYAGSGDAVVSSSFSFDATVTSLWTPLVQGGAVHLLPEHAEIEGLGARIKEGCGLVKITPSHLDLLGRRLLAEQARGFADLVVIGGEALSTSTVELWKRVQPGVRLVNEYGPTETVVGCVVYDIPDAVDLTQPIAIGRPIANTRIYLLDANGDPVPMGAAGEVYIAGAGVARGYLNRPNLTAQCFLPDAFGPTPGARMYKTGDLARYRSNGTMEYLGRRDFQLKVHGFRIEPGEIEARLVDCPGVREAIVVAREEDTDDKRLVAYVVAQEGTELSATALRAQLVAVLPEYMVPAAFVTMDALPLTANGKLDRNALPAPQATAYASRGYEAPVGEIETTLARLWCEVLKLDRVGRQDNFFELGGNSLLAVILIDRICQDKLSIDVDTVFVAPTLAALAGMTGKLRRILL
jgi:amino acid adenylation domain-containing protein